MEKEKSKIPENFTLQMAIMDTLPVIFFCVALVIMTHRFNNPLFLTGGTIVVLAGALKVIWKLIIAIKKQNIYIFNYQLHILMPIGFILMLIAVIFNFTKIFTNYFFDRISSFPTLLFFIMGILCMIKMALLAKNTDNDNAKANWVEQGINSLGQACFLLGILFF